MYGNGKYIIFVSTEDSTKIISWKRKRIPIPHENNIVTITSGAENHIIHRRQLQAWSDGNHYTTPWDEKPIFWEFEKESESQIAGAEYERARLHWLRYCSAEFNYLCAPELHISLEKECCSYLHPSLRIRAKLQCANLMLESGRRAKRKYDAAVAYIYI